jgi:hypothetical protein
MDALGHQRFAVVGHDTSCGHWVAEQTPGELLVALTPFLALYRADPLPGPVPGWRFRVSLAKGKPDGY